MASSAAVLSLMFADDLSDRRRAGENRALQFALIVSVLLHVTAFSAWRVAEVMGWKRGSLTSEVKAAIDTQKIRVELQPAPLTPDEERLEREKPPTQMTFVDVDPATAAKEPPKDAKYYSAISSKAANPNPKRDTDQPEIDGKQKNIVRTFDASRTVVKPTQVEEPPAPKPDPQQLSKTAPEPPKQLAKAQPQPKSEPKRTVQSGRGTPAQTSPTPHPQAKGAMDTLRPQAAPEPPKERPRRINEALAQLGMIAGQRVQQEGGVRRNSIKPSVDAMATPFGNYDALLVAAIQARWDSLIEEGLRNKMLFSSGQVVVTFRLKYDGSVSDMEIVHTTVGAIQAIICQRAIEEPAKYEAWPDNLRRMNKTDYRDVRFTFFYN